MSILRVLNVNLADSSTVVASVTAGSLAASNLLTNIKSQVWRSTGTSATLTASWTVAKTFNCVILPFTNFTNAATMRVRGYANLADVVGVAATTFDTTALTCCPYTAASVFGWDTNVPGVANFGQGGGVYASLFFAGGSAIKIVIDLVDTTNAAGYIEASRLLAGSYWSPTYNVDYGVQVGFKTSSAHIRNDAGDLLTDIRALAKTLTVNFSRASVSDREALMKVLRQNIANPVYISLFPADTDKNLEQDYQIWGKLTQESVVGIVKYTQYSSTFTVDEI
jgi:hypothetical protein